MVFLQWFKDNKFVEKYGFLQRQCGFMNRKSTFKKTYLLVLQLIQN